MEGSRGTRRSGPRSRAHAVWVLSAVALLASALPPASAAPGAGSAASPSVSGTGSPIHFTSAGCPTSAGSMPCTSTHDAMSGDGSSSSGANLARGNGSARTVTAPLTVVRGPGAEYQSAQVVHPAAGFNVSILATPPVTDAGVTVSLNAEANGGSPPYQFSWTLGDGTGATGAVVQHSYATVGNYSINLSASDGENLSASAMVVLPVHDDPTVVASVDPPGAVVDVGQNLLFDVYASAGVGPYNYAYSGLPTGCYSFDTSLLTCRPSDASGTVSVGVRIMDAVGLGAAVSVGLTVNPALLITNLVADRLVVDEGMSVGVTALGSGGTPPLDYTYIGGGFSCTLPTPADAASTCSSETGLSSPTAGRINLTVVDSVNERVQAETQVTIDLLPTLTAAFNQSTIVLGGTAVLDAETSGGTGVLSYSYVGLPPGCATIDSPLVSCPPSESGQYRVTATVTDALGQSANATASLTVLAPMLGGPIGSPDVSGLFAVVATVVVLGTVAITLTVWATLWRRPPPGYGPR